jgi:hypothetical protein
MIGGRSISYWQKSQCRYQAPTTTENLSLHASNPEFPPLPLPSPLVTRFLTFDLRGPWRTSELQKRPSKARSGGLSRILFCRSFDAAFCVIGDRLERGFVCRSLPVRSQRSPPACVEQKEEDPTGHMVEGGFIGHRRRFSSFQLGLGPRSLLITPPLTTTGPFCRETCRKAVAELFIHFRGRSIHSWQSGCFLAQLAGEIIRITPSSQHSSLRPTGMPTTIAGRAA